MRYLLEKNNSWFCYSTLLTQQTLRSEGSLWKPLYENVTIKKCGVFSFYQINMYFGKYALIWVFFLQFKNCDKISSKYQFLQFENFQNTIKTYIYERALVSKLQEFKHFLKKAKIHFSQC